MQENASAPKTQAESALREERDHILGLLAQNAHWGDIEVKVAAMEAMAIGPLEAKCRFSSLDIALAELI